ncbi:SCO2400 family protein, partial [Streptomyces thermocarboxydus]|uniref:SCO2400 family protein n=1 Tax=Streptomyces thermocarboxydus TaxID=59299 RepID=UPI003D15B2F7
MDFCHPCRRHLNGALACPGCGTPVETLRAQQAAAPGGGAPVGTDGGDGYDTGAHRGADEDPGPDEEPADAPPRG